MLYGYPDLYANVCGKSCADMECCWKSYQEIAVQEKAGINRTREPVHVEIQFDHSMTGQDDASIIEDIKREIRVVHVLRGRKI